MNIGKKPIKPVAKEPIKPFVTKPYKTSFEEQNWEEPEKLANDAPINKNVHMKFEDVVKNVNPNIILEENKYGITDFELYQYFKKLDDQKQQVIINLPTAKTRMMVLKFFKEKNIGKKSSSSSPNKSSPLNDFLKKEKFSPYQKKKIMDEWGAEWDNAGFTAPKEDSHKIAELETWDEAPDLLKVSYGEINLPNMEEIFGKNIEDEEAEEEEKEKEKAKHLSAPQIRFEKIVEEFYNIKPFNYDSKNAELEVRFGTRGIQPLTKNDYDNVIQKIKSYGFNTTDQGGLYSLRIQNEFIEPHSGKLILSPIRTEIEGLLNIQNYCNNNNISEILKSSGIVKFTKKSNVFNKHGEKIWPVNFDDFNFRVSFQNEDDLRPNKGAAFYIIDKWKESKKTFRYLNRVTFKHKDYPILVDISIVKSSEYNKRYYSTEDSKIFTRPETYEIELEVDNSKIGVGTNFSNPKSILTAIKKVIKFVLSGLQGTNFPISYPEQKDVINTYMSLLYKDKHDPKKWVNSSNFIGPNSVTLQLSNITPIDENSVEPNIRDNFVVTDKADGARHLMYIDNKGKIYLINTNMNVIFTGAKSVEKEYFNSILDGELIYHDKSGKFINLYAAFDIYFFNKNDVRSLTFMPYEKNKEPEKCRYAHLKNLIDNLNPISIEQSNPESSASKSLVEKFRQSKEIISPIRIECKKFYKEENIFSACNNILSRVKNQLLEYNTDGLIFTPAFLGVGSNKIGESGPIKKVTWRHSFKWKPPYFNTVDFLVTTIKNNGEDKISSLYEDGLNVSISDQITEYKTIQLRCSFDEGKHGYINPCQDIIDDKLPDYKHFMDDKKTNNTKPVQFYPTEPYDPEAGITKIILRNNNLLNNSKKMFTEEDEVFEDNTIVEFRYDMSLEKGWRWIPLRMRYDKTRKMLSGKNEFGNSYDTAESNWKSIHFPVTEEMICSGLNIPSSSINSDKYYNGNNSRDFKTESMKNFHNLFVKKLLIKSVSKYGETLIDFACGKAGDLPKWIESKLSFVFGIDLSKDNLENRLNGACARYLNARKINKNMPYALFVNGNSSQNIRNGSALLNDKAIQITNAVFGNGSKENNSVGPGVSRHFGKGQEGFNISSCQFAMHYFFKTPDILQGFLRNISECTKYNGYFIGTAYDGKTVFDLLKKKMPGENIQIFAGDTKIWEVIKSYDHDKFLDDSSSIGYRIDVFQESINQSIPEYLINFNYLERIMLNYGFKIIDVEEANSIGLPQGCGFFSELFDKMENEIFKNKFKANDYENAPNMTYFEKKISFLNKFFVFKKINKHVNAEQVQLELSEYNEIDVVINTKDTYAAVDIAKEEIKQSSNYSKIKKLNKKLILVPGTEAIELVEVVKAKSVKPPKSAVSKKVKLIIEEE
jgi:hypothetical protein